MFDGHQIVVFDCCNGYDEFLRSAEGLAGHVLVKSMQEAWEHKGSVFFFIIDKATGTNAIWNSIRRGLTCVPVVYVPGSRTLLREQYAADAVYLDRPNIDNLMQSFPKYNAVFLNAHGRPDTLLLRDGRLCGGPVAGNGTAAHNITAAHNETAAHNGTAAHNLTCSCHHGQGCYRSNLHTATIPASATGLLFTNACDAMAFGADALLASDWLFFSSVVKSNLASFVGTPSFRPNYAGEMEFARERYLANEPLWKIVHSLNTALEYFYREYPSYIIYGNPFLRMKPAATAPAAIDAGLNKPPHSALDETMHKLEAGMLNTLKLSWLLNKTIQLDFETVNSLIFQAKEALSKARFYPFQEDDAAKLVARISQLLEQSDRAAADALAVNISEEGSHCVYDHIEKRLAKVPPLKECVCNSCGMPSLEYSYEGGWKSIRCNRCGIARMHSGRELIRSIRLEENTHCNTVTPIEIDCDAYWNCAIVRGKKDRISARKYSRRAAKLFIAHETPPHYYYLRVYAVHNGEVDVFQKLVNVLPSPIPAVQ